MNHDHSNGMGKHMLLMLICCLVPIALIAAVSVFGLSLSLGPLSALLPYALVLMCPLMMIFMMRGMMQGQDADHSQHTVNAPRIASKANGVVETAAPDQKQCH